MMPLQNYRTVSIQLAALLALCGATGAVLGAEAADRMLRKEITVTASPAQVWEAWTTPAGITSFFARGAEVELKPGGKYELFFALDAPQGSRGAEGCRILSFVPRELLSFTWNAPPSIPALREAGVRTQVVVRFDETEPGQVRVRLTQLGFGEGPDWDKYYAYFDNAWSNVLLNLQKRFAPPAVTPGLSPTPEKKEVPADPLEPLARLVGGTWATKGQWAKGDELNMRVAYEWSLNRKLLKARSYVVNADGPKLVYETVCAWHPLQQRIVFYSFSVWGAFYEGTIRAEGDTLSFAWTGYAPGKATEYRQTIKFTDENSYEWTVFARGDSAWEQHMQTTFRREDAPPPPESPAGDPQAQRSAQSTETHLDSGARQP